MLTEIKRKLIEIRGKLEKSWGFQTELKWFNIVAILSFHLLAIYWCYLYAFPVKWQTVLFGVIVLNLSSMGVTCGAHRLWTHRTYKATLPLNIYLVMCYSTVGQNSIYNWVRLHRIHHKYSDTDADPHSIKRGFFFSHMGWMMIKAHPQVIAKGRQIDMSDIEADPIVMFQHRYSTYLGIVFSAILPTLAGIYLFDEDWKCVVAWQNFIRVLLVFHGEWSVNSFAHVFGNKPYNENIKATQNLFVSLITGGEGWHNYHHMFPYDYKASELFNFSSATAFIRLWAKLGLAYELKEPSPEVIQSVIQRHRQNVSIAKDQSDYEFITKFTQ